MNFGLADLQAVLGLIGRTAWSAAWYAKWNILNIRPEALGLEINRVFNDRRNRHNLPDSLLQNPILTAIQNKQHNYVLTQCYPEGAPLYPSTPSGYATHIGAGITVLKFFFDPKHEFEFYIPDNDGFELKWTGKKTTVGEELDKLASNIGFGRMWAGVNFEMDITSGLKRGEKVALTCLSEFIQRYSGPIEIPIKRFNEKVVIIKKI